MYIVGSNDYINMPALLTPFTFVHFYAGFVGFVLIKYFYPKLSFQNTFLIFIILHTIYEIKDLLCYNDWICSNIFNSCSDLDNSIVNSIGDTIASIIGLFIATFCVGKISDIFCINAVTSFFVIWFIFAYVQAG